MRTKLIAASAVLAFGAGSVAALAAVPGAGPGMHYHGGPTAHVLTLDWAYYHG